MSPDILKILVKSFYIGFRISKWLLKFGFWFLLIILFMAPTEEVWLIFVLWIFLFGAFTLFFKMYLEIFYKKELKVKQKGIQSMSNLTDNAIEAEIKRVQVHILNYQTSLQHLKKLNVIRSNRLLQSDYGEWLASKYMGLTLSNNKNEKDFDAYDHEHRRYQIKTRVISGVNKINTSLDLKTEQNISDYLVGVLLEESLFKLIAIFKIEWNDVIQIGRQNKDNFRIRINNNFLKDNRIKKVFPKDDNFWK